MLHVLRTRHDNNAEKLKQRPADKQKEYHFILEESKFQ